MRLMLRGIEIAKPQREVDRIDVFERRRDERRVRGKIGRSDDVRDSTWV